MEQKVDIECANCRRDFSREVSKVESLDYMVCPYCGNGFFYFFEDVGQSLKNLQDMLTTGA